MDNKSWHIPFGERSSKELIDELPKIKDHTKIIFSRLKRVTSIPENAKVLEIGASVGRFVIACNQLGYKCEGVEPSKIALLKSNELSKQLGVRIPIVEGKAESLPYEANSFDVIIANSVIEHVLDVDKAFLEIQRVLKPDGIFWFYTASSMCPLQSEIKGFPLFGWYPNSLKVKIMSWAKNKRPHLVGYADAPAINWFTPFKARRLLRKAGFRKIYDRWDLRGENESGGFHRLVLPIIRETISIKILTDIFITDCSYAAIK